MADPSETIQSTETTQSTETQSTETTQSTEAAQSTENIPSIENRAEYAEAAQDAIFRVRTLSAWFTTTELNEIADEITSTMNDYLNAYETALQRVTRERDEQIAKNAELKRVAAQILMWNYNFTTLYPGQH
jgi:hypothetical protein